MMKKLLTAFLALLLTGVAYGSAPKVSLLTCGPTDDYVFYLYGHTALRVQHEGEDLVYNYGYFSLEQKHFIFNFIIGKPMYSLGVTGFDHFLWEYGAQGRSVVEQQLALTDSEATAIANKLKWNALPENRDYQYNFYFDNCATRPRDLIEEAVGGITYLLPADSLPTFRQAIRRQSHTAVWYTMGADLCLGWKSDRQMSLRDAAFLPSLLEEELDSAVRDDTGAPLVSDKVVWLKQDKVIENKYESWHLPLVLFLFLMILYFILYYKRRERPLRFLRRTLYLLLGLGGVTVWFLAIGSEHPHTWPNANMLLLHPVWLFMAFRKTKRMRTDKWLYFCNFVAVVVYLLSGFLLQELPMYISILAVWVAADQYLMWREARR
ncbi:MAG: DUF4105 domain-containing protein [Porphyromonas sp.]|nr:DUF4105 domain-containing protein [Porphyromonas sp.]